MTTATQEAAPAVEMQKVLPIPARYYRVYTNVGTPCVESNFHFVEKELPVPAGQAALILIDVWSTHYIDSYVKRTNAIVREKLAPALEAARRAGVTVIHAPSPALVERDYPEAMPPTPPAAASEQNQWPPAEFRGIYRGGRYAAFGRDPETELLTRVYADYKVNQHIAEGAKPAPGDIIISDATQLQEVLAERRILHLFYTGFASNWCLMYRDYGIVALNNRGYNIILLRDATTGIECADTVETTAATAMTIREIEVKFGWSTTTADFIEACRTAETAGAGTKATPGRSIG